MRTVPKIERQQVTAAKLRTQVSGFEAAHPRTDRTNYIDVFRSDDGELNETDEFFEVDGLYHALDTVERLR